MNNTLYLECYSGISGDMLVAALLDLGADKMVLDRALQSLQLDGFSTEITRVKKAGLDACDFHVVLDSIHENHDHDMNYLHGEEHKHEEHVHSHHHSHLEEQKGNAKEHHHTHEHRGLLEIIHIIQQADMTVKAKELAVQIFKIIARAEAKAHGVDVEAVHFHEVGAVDSIVDIVSAAVCFDNLKIEEVIVPKLYEGQGFVRCQHGTIPIPVPAVVNIAADYELQLHITSTECELVTPTGAAIVAAIQTQRKLPDEFTIERVGIGAGKRTYDRPSLLRAMFIQEKSRMEDAIIKLETNIDDCSGENLGFVMERLFEAGAKDVHYLPVFMKKNRPAYQLNVICHTEDVEAIEQIIFKETTTIGIRKIKMERTILKREMKKVNTSLGEVQVKVCHIDSGKRFYPEYNSVVDICNKHRMSYQEAYHIIICEIQGE
jgi:uncharacterized protein (TIGR00299 family) protein